MILVEMVEHPLAPCRTRGLDTRSSALAHTRGVGGLSMDQARGGGAGGASAQSGGSPGSAGLLCWKEGRRVTEVGDRAAIT